MGDIFLTLQIPFPITIIWGKENEQANLVTGSFFSTADKNTIQSNKFVIPKCWGDSTGTFVIDSLVVVHVSAN